MTKSIALIVLALFFSMNLSGCSLFSSGDEEQETATVAENGALNDEPLEDEFGEGGDEFGDGGDDFASGTLEGENLDFDSEAMAKGDGEAGFDVGGTDIEVEDGFGDEYPDDDYASSAEGKTSAGSDFSEDYIDDNSFAGDDGFGEFADDSLYVDEGGGIPATPMTGNQEEDLFGKDLDPVVDTPTYADTDYSSGSDFDDTGYADTGFGDTGSGEPKSFVPVKKMKPAAYKRAGGNVNRLYVVRPGDNMDSIAEILYGNASRSEDLYAYNSHFRGKTLKVGDKVYYESPNNKDDQSMKTYYEDVNQEPQYYTSQDGDNIRAIAKKLLGHDRSWMEIWATNNNIESKGRLPEGLQIRYWPAGGTPTMAMNEPSFEEPEPVPEPTFDEPEPMTEPSEPVAMDEPAEIPDFEDAEELPVDEPAEVAQLDDPKPFDDDMDEDFASAPPTAGSMNSPPPPKAAAPPSPPPVSKSNVKPVPPKAGASSGDPLGAMGDDSMVMGALGGLLILAAIIMLIFIRRSRAKRVNFSQTQI